MSWVGSRRCCSYIYRQWRARATLSSKSGPPYRTNINLHSSRGLNSGSFCVHPKVSRALERGDPVVALETTIVTHGMPRPQNLETALEVERVVCSAGAVPATIGVLDGTVHVGLTHSQLEELATSECVYKISQRDLPYCISQGCSGGTTVAGTMLCAHKAGIPVFVTGGVGGVHRGGQHSLDISADLAMLGRTPVAVVCAGVKSILDIGRTLEYLETQGVPVLTVGHSETFPAFFTPDSGHKAPYSVPSPLEAARVIDASLGFGVGCGMLFGVPLTSPDAGSLGEEVEQAIQQALEEATQRHVSGKDITPFVLQRVSELTGGKSLRTNVELIKNNASVGSQIAVELARLRREKGGARSSRRKDRPPSSSQKKDVVVIGSSIVDFTAKLQSLQILRDGTNPGSLRTSFGGVGRNIAECMSRLGATPLLLSAVGQDENGKLVCDHLTECGLSLDGVRRSEFFPTATYCVLLDHRGEFHFGVGDMDILGQVSVEWIQQFEDDIVRASYVCIDGNISEETMKYILNFCSSHNVPVWFEPTCLLKSRKPFQLNCQDKIAITSPNFLELRNMHHSLTSADMSTKSPMDLSLEEKLSECVELVRPILLHIPTVLVSLGSDGVLYCCRQGGKQQCLHYPAAAAHLLPVSVLSVSGAGDSFVGSMLTGISKGLTLDLSVKAGLNAAYLSLQSPTAISSQLTPQLLRVDNIKQWAPWDARTVVNVTTDSS